MPHDWIASGDRLLKTLAGSKRVDKVPLVPLVDEQMITRIMGVTVKELFNSPKLFANAIIATNEFFHADIITTPNAYAGPAEAHAFAEINNKLNLIKWSDYKTFCYSTGRSM